MSVLSDVTYLLPIRRLAVPSVDELPAYLATIAGLVREVIVVDGSDPAIFALHAAAWGMQVRHVAVDPACPGKNGKVRGVRTGMALASTEYVVIADDDVRYGHRELDAVRAALAVDDIVRPQNYFDPLPWHALLDEGRSLIARVSGGDWPGTLGVRRATYLRAGGYNGDVLFENFELVQTIRTVGGTERVLENVFVTRRPPTVAHYFGQRVRQAYDEFARPARLTVQLALGPAAIAFISRIGLVGAIILTLLITSIAEVGRRRGGATTYFPPAASMLASLWVVERCITAWLAISARLAGGIPYAGRQLRGAATGRRKLQKRLRGAGA